MINDRAEGIQEAIIKYTYYAALEKNFITNSIVIVPFVC